MYHASGMVLVAKHTGSLWHWGSAHNLVGMTWNLWAFTPFRMAARGQPAYPRESRMSCGNYALVPESLSSLPKSWGKHLKETNELFCTVFWLNNVTVSMSKHFKTGKRYNQVNHKQFNSLFWGLYMHKQAVSH